MSGETSVRAAVVQWLGYLRSILISTINHLFGAGVGASQLRSLHWTLSFQWLDTFPLYRHLMGTFPLYRHLGLWGRLTRREQSGALLHPTPPSD